MPNNKEDIISRLKEARIALSQKAVNSPEKPGLIHATIHQLRMEIDRLENGPYKIFALLIKSIEYGS